eukprot:TRINITY_DN3830_c0_g3_i1.p1 TRINITY_DN3830_c0_g3~~TRINITY_DN3830_c0_g3_i1.p1  ORF type:complete len:244 (+),score=68.55 TRINITY_DN3830_c0_g3_i1:136-867(+)
MHGEWELIEEQRQMFEDRVESCVMSSAHKVEGYACNAARANKQLLETRAELQSLENELKMLQDAKTEKLGEQDVLSNVQATGGLRLKKREDELQRLQEGKEHASGLDAKGTEAGPAQLRKSELEAEMAARPQPSPSIPLELTREQLCAGAEVPTPVAVDPSSSPSVHDAAEAIAEQTKRVDDLRARLANGEELSSELARLNDQVSTLQQTMLGMGRKGRRLLRPEFANLEAVVDRLHRSFRKQ